MTNRFVYYGKEFLLIMILITIAVIGNKPALVSNYIYSEQTLYYNVNQMIHSVSDLIDTYVHPRLLDSEVAFSRPSGNFLMYQLLTPWLGWYNLQALMVVNYLFLGLIGYLIIKFYAELFPGFKVGGYIAFSLYLMNPSLVLSRLAVMHFDFAYVFFAMLSWYLFVIFCKRNFTNQTLPATKIHQLHLLFAAVFFYMVAITFKEAAIILGPVLMLYLFCSVYQRGQFFQALKNKEILQLIIFLVAVTATLTVYVAQPLQYIPRIILIPSQVNKILYSAYAFFCNLFFIPVKNQAHGDHLVEIYRMTNIPAGIRYTVWILLLLTLVSLINIYRQQNGSYKKPVTSLLLSFIVLLSMPVLWGMALPWHLSLTLVCEALIIGFCFEFYARNFANKAVCNFAGFSLAVVLAASTYQVDQRNLDFINHTLIGFDSKLIYNAVFNPPPLKNKLNDKSILVEQDNMGLGDVLLGDTTYPMLALYRTDNFDFDYIVWTQAKNFWPMRPLYNGTLFRWAYSLPNLNEETILFDFNDMKNLPDAILLSWVRHLDNIFCVTYDKAANWFDNTANFKENVLREQKRRQLTVNAYHLLPQTALHSLSVKYKRLPYPDAEICQTYCDTHKKCKGFTYTSIVKDRFHVGQCFFYNTITADKRPCKICTGYIKAI